MPERWMDGWPPDSKWREYFKDGIELARERRCPACREIPDHEDGRATYSIGGLMFVFHGKCHEAFVAETKVDPIDWREPQAA